MVFTEEISNFSFDNYEHSNWVVGQKWPHPDLTRDSFILNKSKQTAFMYPWVTNVNTLKKIVKYYKLYCELMRSLDKSIWTAEMNGLYYATLHENIHIEVKDYFGHCTAWWLDDDNNFNRVSPQDRDYA